MAYFILTSQVNHDEVFYSCEKLGPREIMLAPFIKLWCSRSQQQCCTFICALSCILLVVTRTHFTVSGVRDFIYLRGCIYVLLSGSLQYTFYSQEKLNEEGMVGAHCSVATIYNVLLQNVTLQRENSY